MNCARQKISSGTQKVTQIWTRFSHQLRRHLDQITNMFWLSFTRECSVSRSSHQHTLRGHVPKQSTCWIFQVDSAARLRVCTLQLALQVAKLSVIWKAFTLRHTGTCSAAVLLFCCEHWRFQENSCQIFVFLGLRKGWALSRFCGLSANECCAKSLEKRSLQLCLQVTYSSIERETLATSSRITFALATAGFFQMLFCLLWFVLDILTARFHLVHLYFLLWIMAKAGWRVWRETLLTSASHASFSVCYLFAFIDSPTITPRHFGLAATASIDSWRSHTS